jgi:hypothetical protein
MVECCEAIDEKCTPNTHDYCRAIQIEFWYLSNSYISDEKCFVGNCMDAEYEWLITDCYMYNYDIHNQCAD